MRLWSLKPVFSAIRILTSSTVASLGRVTVSGSFLIGFFGARFVSFRERVDDILADCLGSIELRVAGRRHTKSVPGDVFNKALPAPELKNWVV
jgi:hypothetical protein